MNDGQHPHAGKIALATAQDKDTSDRIHATRPAQPAAASEPAFDRWEVLRLPVIAEENYRVAAEIAQGGNGRIVRARDNRLHRPVALKEMLADGGLGEERFVREALLTARLQHPSIIPVYEAGRWPTGQPFFAMKLVSGHAFAAVIEQARTLDARLALLPHVLAVAEAMAYAHSERIIHRDLKPANVLVGDFGETVVIDWGLAKDLATDNAARSLSDPGPAPSEPGTTAGQGLTWTGAILGTPAYMPPEQAEGGAVDERADVYALGAILYHVLAGKAPFDGPDGVAVLGKVLAGPPPALEHVQRGVPEDLEAIVNKAMARNRADRYPTARELSEDLRRFQTGKIVGAHRYSALELFVRFVRRQRTIMAALAAALLVLLTLGTVSLRRILDARDIAAARQKEAEAAQQKLTERADDLIVVQARTSLEDDPNRTLAWLKTLSPTFDRWSAARIIAADAQSRGIATVLRGHSGTINALAFSPDGRTLATASDDRTVRLWDRVTGRSRQWTDHHNEVWRVAFSHDGKTLVTGGLEPTLRVWDVATGTSRALPGYPGGLLVLAIFDDDQRLFSTGADGTWHVREISSGRILASGHEQGIQIAFSPRSHFIAGRDARDKIRLFNLDRLEQQPVEAAAPLVRGRHSMAFSPDGRRLATIHTDDSVGVWDIAAGKGRMFAGHTGPIDAIAFSPDGRWVASGAQDRTVRLWDASTGQVRVFEGHAQGITALSFSHDSRQLASGGRDHTVRLWDLESGTVSVLVGFDDVVTVLGFSPDNETLAAAGYDRSVRLWSTRLTTSRIFRGHEGSILAEAFSPDGELLATGGQDGSLRLWNLSLGDSIRQQAHEGGVHCVVFSPDGRRLATAGADGAVRLWSISGELEQTHAGHQAAVHSIAFSPDQKLLASGGGDGTVRLWNLDTGESWIFSGHTQAVHDVLFARNGEVILSAAADGTVRLWNRASGEGIVLQGHSQQVLTLALSPDGKLLASAGTDRTLRLWDAQTGALLRVIPIGGVTCAQIFFAPDGKDMIVFAGDNAAQIFDVATGTLRRILRGHEGVVESGALSPDGRMLATASRDMTVRLWDLATGESRVLRGHTGIVRGVQFSPDGKRIASIGADGTARLWFDDLPAEPAELRSWLNSATQETIDMDRHREAPRP